jgi:regulatory protein
LARREHSGVELRRKLRGKGYDPERVEDAVEALDAEGLLSDRRFTEEFIRGRFNRGSGPRKIEAELGQRGVGDALVEELLDARDAEWKRLARDVRRRRFGDEIPKDFKERARQKRFLQGRGFTHEQIRAALGDDEEY